MAEKLSEKELNNVSGGCGGGGSSGPDVYICKLEGYGPSGYVVTTENPSDKFETYEEISAFVDKHAQNLFNKNHFVYTINYYIYKNSSKHATIWKSRCGTPESHPMY